MTTKGDYVWLLFRGDDVLGVYCPQDLERIDLSEWRVLGEDDGVCEYSLGDGDGFRLCRYKISLPTLNVFRFE